MEVDDMISTMKANLKVLEEEKKEIENDVNECYEMTKKFGHFWDSAINMLNGLLREKEEDMKEIRLHLSLLNIHLQNCQKLVDRLQEKRFQIHRKGSSFLRSDEENETLIEITSPILAKSRRNLSFSRLQM